MVTLMDPVNPKPAQGSSSPKAAKDDGDDAEGLESHPLSREHPAPPAPSQAPEAFPPDVWTVTKAVNTHTHTKPQGMGHPAVVAWIMACTLERLRPARRARIDIPRIPKLICHFAWRQCQCFVRIVTCGGLTCRHFERLWQRGDAVPRAQPGQRPGPVRHRQQPGAGGRAGGRGVPQLDGQLPECVWRAGPRFWQERIAHGQPLPALSRRAAEFCQVAILQLQD